MKSELSYKIYGRLSRVTLAEADRMSAPHKVRYHTYVVLDIVGRGQHLRPQQRWENNNVFTTFLSKQGYGTTKTLKIPYLRVYILMT